MNDRQKNFVIEYVKDFNATRAYETAYPGTSKKVAGTCGHRLLKNVEIQKYIKKYTEDLRTEKTASTKEVLEYLTSVMRGESKTTKYFDSGKSCKVTPSEKERLKAAEQLAKVFGMETKNVRVEGDVEVGVKIIDDIG